MFRSFGHQTSSIIDGGLPRWADEGLPLETTKPTQPRSTHYPAPNLNEKAIKSTLYLSSDFLSFSPYISGYDQIVSNSKYDPAKNVDSALVLDARSRGRYV